MMVDVDIVTSKVRERFISHLLFGKISLNPKGQAFLQLLTVGFLHLSVVIFLEKGLLFLIYTE